MTYLYDNSYCTKCLIAILLIAVPAIAGLPLSPGAGDNITGNSSEMVESTAGASSNGTEVELTPSTSPHAPYDCSAANSTFRQARAIASFKKGLNLIDDLRERSLGRLIVTQQKGCPPNDITLSMLNVADYPDLRRTGLQGMADSVAKVKVYAALVKKSLDANYSDDMQALYDILQGITKEIYILLSPEYCGTCLASPDRCFTIPNLRIDLYFRRHCNIISHISSTVSLEMRGVREYTQSWIDGHGAISTRDWLAAHVRSNSPAYTKLL